MKRYINIVFMALIIIIGIAFYFAIDHWNKNKQYLQTTSPQISNIKVNRFISGTIVPAKEVEIKSQFSGVIERLYCQVGDRVKVGEKVAKIRHIPDPGALENAQKNVNTTLIEYQSRKKAYERNKKLFEQKVISESEFEKHKTAYMMSKEHHESAMNQLKLLQEGFKNRSDDLSNLVYATTDGTVLELPLKIGASVIKRNNFNAGTTIVKIADLSSLLFKGAVNESDITFVKEGQSLYLSIPSLQKNNVVAELINVSPKGSLKNNTIHFEIEANILNPAKISEIRTGFSAIAEIIIEQKKEVLTIEEKNVMFEHDSAYVEVLADDQNSFSKKPINVGISDGIKIEVKKGLSLRDEIRKLDL